MCEIQLMYRLNKNLVDRDRKEFIKLMKKGAVSNSDAYGIFSKDYIVKQGKSFKTRIANLERDNQTLKFIDTNFLVGHNRLATNGKAKLNDNNHPFDSKNFIIVHNGVLWNDEELKRKYNFDYEEEVDSIVISHLLEYFVKETKCSPLEAVKEVAESLEGSYSVMVYSKKEDCLYYFKNSRTSFYFGLVKDNDGAVLMGSTNEESLEEAYIEYDMIFPISKFLVKTIVEAEEEIIYKIDKNEIRKELEFEKAYSSWGRDSGKDYRNFEDYSFKKYTLEDWEDNYPQITDFIEKMRDDFGTIYGLKSWQTDYRRGTLWFRCSDEDVVNSVLDTYSFAKRTKKGIKLTFEDIWNMLSTIYGVTKEKEEEFIYK